MIKKDLNKKNGILDMSKNNTAYKYNQIFKCKEVSRNGIFYIENKILFSNIFQTIPNIIKIDFILFKEANEWLMNNYKNEIKDIHYYKEINIETKKLEIVDIYYFLYNDLIVHFTKEFKKYCVINLLFKNTEISKIEKLVELIMTFEEKEAEEEKPEIYLLVESKFGLRLNNFEINKTILNIDENYNDDFNEVNQIILKRLSNKNDKGIVLLHGKPGTGKTTYIRYLISSVKKNLIFIPPNLASALTNPNLINLLSENPNTILIIEDAEQLINDRENVGNSPVSGLLNIADGLLSDFLNIQILCTFNNDLTKIDSALTRQGRLIAMYEFKELDIPKAQKLSNNLGFKTNIDKPMTLASIYNQNEKDASNKNNRIKIGY